tara:strand:- start:862 stop:1770 length:909 start_codon:yes stop_codon:yes gene_type:complete
MSTSVPPLVTVCIPAYNHERYIGQAIEAILDQTYANIELIIVDDGSHDATFDIIARYRGRCVARCVRFEAYTRPNKGLSATLNEMVSWARGKYLAPIASDDIASPEKIARLVGEMEEHPEVVGAFGAVALIDDDGNSKGTLTRPGFWTFEDVILARAMMPAPTSVLRTDAVRAVGGYDEDMMIEDFSLWLKLTHDGTARLITVADILAKYRLHKNNMHTRVLAMHEGRMAILERYRDHPAYAQARSTAIITAAHESTRHSLTQAMRLLKSTPDVNLRTRLAIVVKSVLPNTVLDWMKRARGY